jgi:geranylgeranyl pyrophosphate synthase
MIAEGEILQLMNSGNPNLDEAAYLTVIQRKTAKLFDAAAQLGAVMGGASPARQAALARYGMHLGTSFQLVDDVLGRTGALDYALRCAVRESESAAACVTGLPMSPHRESLLELAAFAARRTY